MTSAYMIQNIDGMMGSDEIERFEISDALCSANVEQIALWCGGFVDEASSGRKYLIIEWDDETGMAMDGDRVVKEFRSGGNLPTGVYAISAWAYDSILKRFL